MGELFAKPKRQTKMKAICSLFLGLSIVAMIMGYWVEGKKSFLNDLVLKNREARMASMEGQREDEIVDKSSKKSLLQMIRQKDEECLRIGDEGCDAIPCCSPYKCYNILDRRVCFT